MSKKKDSISEQDLVDRARRSVREHPVPDDVLRRLRVARSEAVAQVSEHTGFVDNLFSGGRWLIPTGAAAVLVLAVSMIGSDQTELMPMMDEQELAAVSDMELLDDIEFLAWMLEEDSSPGTPDDS